MVRIKFDSINLKVGPKQNAEEKVVIESCFWRFRPVLVFEKGLQNISSEDSKDNSKVHSKTTLPNNLKYRKSALFPSSCTV